MSINEIYGDEAIGEDFLVALRRKGYSDGELFRRGSKYAAALFVDIAVEMDSEMENDYYPNLGKLCLDLSRTYPDFHKKLKQNVDEFKGHIPEKASMLLYNQ